MWGSCSYHLWHFLSWGPRSRIGETIHLFLLYHRSRREYIFLEGVSQLWKYLGRDGRSERLLDIFYTFLCCGLSGNCCDGVESATSLVWKVSWRSSKYVTKWSSYSKVVCNLEWDLNALSYLLWGTYADSVYWILWYIQWISMCTSGMAWSKLLYNVVDGDDCMMWENRFIYDCLWLFISFQSAFNLAPRAYPQPCIDLMWDGFNFGQTDPEI